MKRKARSGGDKPVKANRSRALVCLLAACLGLVCACAANPPREELYQKLLDYFENLGYACELSPLADSGRDVPIAGPEAWDSLMLDGREEVLVYFDESNRADYLSGRVDTERYGLATRFGLRFVLVYGGADEGVREALETIPNEWIWGGGFAAPFACKKALRMGRKRGGNAASFAWKAPFTCKGAFGQ